MAMRLVVEMIVLILKQFPPFLIQLFATNAHKDERHALDKEEAQKNHPNTITELRNFLRFTVFLASSPPPPPAPLALAFTNRKPVYNPEF